MFNFFKKFKRKQVLIVNNATEDDVVEIRKKGIELLHMVFLQEKRLPRERIKFVEDVSVPGETSWHYDEWIKVDLLKEFEKRFYTLDETVTPSKIICHGDPKEMSKFILESLS